MKQTPNIDICIIGAGTGGMKVAASAAQMGAKVVLIEENKMGGESLNSGCIPSKSLLASARVAKLMRNATPLGIKAVNPEIDYQKIKAHVKTVMETISAQDSIEKFTNLGVTVISGKAQFVDAETVKVNDTTIKARRFVIASGSSPAIPGIAGLSNVPFYTNESIFDLSEKPAHLVIIGGSPIGCELAQAFALLGSQVTLLEAQKILPKYDADAVDIIRQEFIKDRIDLFENVKILNMSKSNTGISLTFESGGNPRTIDGTHLLLAAGRRPNLNDLNLEAAGINYTPRGIQVNARLQTSNKKIYAIGDVIGDFHFTHIANYQANIVIRNILFRQPAKANYHALPSVTFTEPELAQVGMTTESAKHAGKRIKEFVTEFKENDRAQAENQTMGIIKVITSRSGKILGTTIVSTHAGELILPWILAINSGLSINAMTSVVAPYPTLSEISKKVAFTYYTPKLYSKFMKFVVRMLAKFG